MTRGSAVEPAGQSPPALGTVADGEDVNDVRVHDLMTRLPAVITTTTSIRDAASVMVRGRFPGALGGLTR